LSRRSRPAAARRSRAKIGRTDPPVAVEERLVPFGSVMSTLGDVTLVWVNSYFFRKSGVPDAHGRTIH
jgi:hypothetical protein